MKYKEFISSYLDRTNESGESLAEKAGISRATFYRILRGKNDPRISSLESILKAAGYSICIVPNTPPAGQEQADG